MAKQVGIFKFTGKLGNQVGYKLGDVYITRTNGKLDLLKMRTAPQYEETRKNQSAFATASKAGKLFRQALMGITKGYTDHNYPAEVVSTMLKALRADCTQPKGQQTLNNGLKNTDVQTAFKNLHIYSHRACQTYKSCLIQPSTKPNEYLLNHYTLWQKSQNTCQKIVSLGYLHIDFEASIAHYEPVLSIHCTRNEQQEYSTLTLTSSTNTTMPWTFLVMQVSNASDGQDSATLEHISICDVIDNAMQQPVEKPQIKPKAELSNQIIHLQINGVKSQVNLALQSKYSSDTRHKKKRSPILLPHGSS